jgi:hypothetical protein
MLYTESTYQLMHSISIEFNFLHRSMVSSTKLPTKVAKRVVLLWNSNMHWALQSWIPCIVWYNRGSQPAL